MLKNANLKHFFDQKRCGTMTGMKNRVDKALNRLRAVMRANKWSQVETAAQIGVTQKTLSFWLTGKTQPVIEKVRVIEEFCNKNEQSNRKSNKSNRIGNKSNKTGNKGNDEEFTTKVLKGILLESQAGKEFDERDKISQDKHREYYNGKMIALSLEEKNNSRLILYPSLSGTKDEWYKMGGQSALFYKYIVGPRLKKKPVIRKDNDLRHRFKHGIVSVHWGEKFMKDAATIGLTVKRIDYGLIIVEMERVYTASEIMEMHKREQEDAEKVKKMIMPARNYPDIYALIRQLSQILPVKVKKMDGAYREVFGKTMLEILTNLNKIYFRMANGRMRAEVAREEMLGQIDDMTAMLAIMDENQLFDVTTRTRIGETIVDMKMTIKKRLK